MNSKYLALAVALAISTPAFAAAPVSDTQTVTNGLFDAEWTFSVIANNIYQFDLSAISSVFTKSTGTSSVAATIFDSFDHVVADLGVTTNSSKPTSSNWTSFTALANGTYTLVWAGSSNKVTTTATATVSNITPVPGPEAGAGLGAFALGGLALFMKSRRKDDALAA